MTELNIQIQGRHGGPKTSDFNNQTIINYNLHSAF